MLYDMREIGRWKTALKNDVLRLQEKVDPSAVPRLTDWLTTQDAAHKTNPHALRLAYTEALVVNLALYIKSSFAHVEPDLLTASPDDIFPPEADTGAYLDPIHKAPVRPAVDIVRTAAGAASAAHASPAKSSRLARIQASYDKLTEDYAAQTQRMEELVHRQERLERELREERHELTSQRTASQKQKRDDAERLQRLGASLEEEAKKNHILTNMLNKTVDQKLDGPGDGDPPRSSGLHRLFSGKGGGRAATRPRHREDGTYNLDDDSDDDPTSKRRAGSAVAPGAARAFGDGGARSLSDASGAVAGVNPHRAEAMAAARALQNEVMEHLVRDHPDLAQEDKEAVCWDVARSVAQLVPPLEDLQSSAIGQVQGRVRKFRSSIKMGQNLFGETKEATEKLQARIKHLEQQLEGRQRRVRDLEDVINGSLSDEQKILALQRDLDTAVSGHNKVQSLLDGKLDASEDFDQFLSDELRSMRDAFSIKLGLANQQVENMQKQHLEQIRKMAAEGEAERAALRQQITRLRAGGL